MAWRKRREALYAKYAHMMWYSASSVTFHNVSVEDMATIVQYEPQKIMLQFRISRKVAQQPAYCCASGQRRGLLGSPRMFAGNLVGGGLVARVPIPDSEIRARCISLMVYIPGRRC
jgi:hypothetical protein